MYVIVGANGYLGAYMMKSILEMTDEPILAVCRSASAGENSKRVTWVNCDISVEADVKNLNEKYFEPSPSNKVIYLAAYHHPDMVEKNPRIAWNINVTSLSRFINLMSNVTGFFYPSTDSVYGDSIDNHHFCETDALNPANTYGRNKIAAEAIVSCYGHHVVRYPFLVAPSLTNKKHFYDVIAETIQSGKPFEMFNDSYRSSLDFGTVADLTIKLMEKVVAGETVPNVLNVCGDDDLSKYDIGLMIAERVGVSRDLIRPISIAQSEGIFEAKRAVSTLMDNSLVKKVLGLDQIKIKL